MKIRVKTSTLVWSSAGLLICLVAIGIFFGNTTPPPAVIALLLTFLLTLLITCVIIAWRLKRRLGTQKFILLCGAVAFVWCGLFPPWVYTIYQTGTRDEAGVRSESDAGYCFILAPPRPRADAPAYGVKLDTGRLLVEWACILAVSGAAWAIFNAQKPTEAGAPAAERENAPFPFGKSDFKNDPQIDRALEVFKKEKGNFTDLPESPRMHHYNFAYKALPGLAFADPHVFTVVDNVVAALGSFAAAFCFGVMWFRRLAADAIKPARLMPSGKPLCGQSQRAQMEFCPSRAN